MSERANLAAVCVLAQQGLPSKVFVLWSNVENKLTRSEIPDAITVMNNEGVVTITASESCFIAVSVIRC